MVKCPLCGNEVEYFIRTKRSKYAKCPACGKSFVTSEHPELEQFIKVVEEPKPVEQPQGQVSEEVAEVKKPKPKPLFEEPKPVEDIVAEVLEEWGCDKDFIDRIVNYIQRKGGNFDAGWLMNMLLHARTGRKFTEQEAYMVVDEIVSMIQQEKQKAESMGRPYIGSIIVSGSYQRPGFYTPTFPSTQPYYPPQPYYIPPPTPQYHTPTPTYQQPPITPQMIQEMINKALEDFKKKSEVDELRSKVVEVDKKLIETKAELEKVIAKSFEELNKIVKETLANLPVQQAPAQPSIDKKDIELMKTELEKAYIQKLSELEKKFLEAKTEAEKKELIGQIESLRREIDDLRREASKPVSPEGWQKDETRLVAELGTRFFDIIKDRRPIEYLVKIIPKQAPPPAEERKTEKSLEDMIKEAGGVVE